MVHRRSGRSMYKVIILGLSADMVVAVVKSFKDADRILNKQILNRNQWPCGAIDCIIMRK